jgi:hypothetical protein
MPAQQVPQLAGCFGVAPPPLPGRQTPGNG